MFGILAGLWAFLPGSPSPTGCPHSPLRLAPATAAAAQSAVPAQMHRPFRLQEIKTPAKEQSRRCAGNLPRRQQVSSPDISLLCVELAHYLSSLPVWWWHICSAATLWLHGRGGRSLHNARFEFNQRPPHQHRHQHASTRGESSSPWVATMSCPPNAGSAASPATVPYDRPRQQDPSAGRSITMPPGDPDDETDEDDGEDSGEDIIRITVTSATTSTTTACHSQPAGNDRRLDPGPGPRRGRNRHFPGPRGERNRDQHAENRHCRDPGFGGRSPAASCGFCNGRGPPRADQGLQESAAETRLSYIEPAEATPPSPTGKPLSSAKSMGTWASGIWKRCLYWTSSDHFLSPSTTQLQKAYFLPQRTLCRPC